MKGVLSILLIADRHTPLLAGIDRLHKTREIAEKNCDEYDFMVLLNGCDLEVSHAVCEVMGGMVNAKVVKLASETDPDSAILEGLQRSIGDHVFVGSVRDAALEEIPAMLALAADGHEVVIAEPRIGHMTYPHERLDYGTRLMTRAAVHFVTHAGATQISAYHLLPRHDLFTPARIRYVAMKKPAESFVRGVRRRWRALLSSQVMPLRLVSGLALFGALANIAYSLYVLGIYLVKNEVAPGWATLSLQSSGMYLLFSMALFVLTEYLIGMIRIAQVNQHVRVVQEIRSRTVTFDRENLERA